MSDFRGKKLTLVCVIPSQNVYLRFEYTTYRNYNEKSGGIISLQIWLMQIRDILPLVVTKLFIL